MKTNKVLYLVALLGIMLSKPKFVQADHIMGSDLTYRTSGTNDSIWIVTFNFYRDCTGCYVLNQSPKCGTSENCSSSQTAPTTLTMRCMDNSTNVGTLNLTRKSITDITRTCKKAQSKCEQPCTTSYPFGIEKHVFEGTLDLRTAMKNGCCRFELFVLLYVRNLPITTGQSQQSFYTFAELDACTKPSNSSPILANDPVAILCCNRPYFFNNGATDTSNHDSLSVSFAPAYQNRGQLNSYSGIRTPQNPISAYYPSPLKFPYANPNASPPIGLFVDSVTGDMVFTPVDCNQVAVVVMQINEWRKDPSGKYKNIGVTRRDMQLIVTQCSDNNPPLITNSKYNYNVCGGEKICFDVTTNDKVYIPPPPASSPDPDSVTLSWNHGISGATFTIVNKDSLHETGQFCWTPPKSAVSTLPYTFTVTATDNSCPLNALTTRSFRVFVKDVAVATKKIEDLHCGNYLVSSKPSSDFQGTPEFIWKILNDSGVTIKDSSIAYFSSNSSYVSSKQQDTIHFNIPGKYIIHHTINSSSTNCPAVDQDTVVVAFPLGVTLGSDTLVCQGATLRLEPGILRGNAPHKYQWGTPYVKNPADTFAYKDIRIPDGKRDTSLIVIITDKYKCQASDTIKIYLKPAPFVSLGPDLGMCAYDSVTIVPKDSLAWWDDPRDAINKAVKQGDTIWVEWRYNGTSLQINRKLTTNKNGTYTLQVTEDGKGCSATDTLRIFLKPMPFVDLGPDIRICSYNSVSLNSKDSLTYLDDPRTQAERNKDTVLMEWEHNGKFLQSQRNLKTSIAGKYNLKLTEDRQGCTFSDTMNLFLNDTVKANAGPDQTKRWNETLTLVASGFDSLSSNKTGEYRWWDITTTPGNRINKGNTAKVQFQITRTSDYQVELFVTEDTTTCFDQDIVHVKVDSTGGISANNRKAQKINFWPNPLSGDLNLNFTILGEKPVSVLIWDLNGKLVTSRNDIYEEKGIMTLEAILQGFYILEVRGFNSSRFEKLIIQ